MIIGLNVKNIQPQARDTRLGSEVRSNWEERQNGVETTSGFGV